MRIDAKKLLFIGINEEKSAFFEKAQELGIIQFVDMHKKGHYEISSEAETILSAIKVLRGIPPTEQDEIDEYALAGGLAYKVVQLKQQLDKLQEEERILKLEIARVGVFGDFSVSDIRSIEKEGNRIIQFFCAKPNATVPEELIFIASDQGLDYFVGVSEKPKQYEGMIEMQIDQPVGELKEKLSIVHQDIHAVEARIKTYAKYNGFFHKAFVHQLDSVNLKTNKEYSKKEGDLFAVEGWVPVDKLDQAHHLVAEMHVVAEEIAPDETDVAPTCLENTGLSRIGEDLVHIYDTPSNTDKDPSLWVLIWFSLFFSIIIGDAGYGLVFLGTALYLRYKFSVMKPLASRLWKLLLIVSIVSICWGLLMNSFFGLALSPDHPLRERSFLTWLSTKKIEYHIENETQAFKDAIQKYPQLAEVRDPKQFLLNGTKVRDGELIHELADSTASGVLMELALTIGILHILFSMGRYMGRNLASIGWMIAIIGGWLYLPVYIKTPSILNYVFHLPYNSDGLYIMAGGTFLALVLSIYQHRVKGVLEPLTAIQIFADILSYLRLYALGLAGGIVSTTINTAAFSLGPVLAIIPLMIGHTINIALAIMGGVIHGLRLNFLEWYHYSFEGGGKKYNPLKKLSKEL